LEEPCTKECVEVTPFYIELVDVTLIDFPTKNIPTSIILPPYTPSSLTFMDLSISIFLESETYIIYAPNLDQTHELYMDI